MFEVICIIFQPMKRKVTQRFGGEGGGVVVFPRSWEGVWWSSCLGGGGARVPKELIC